MAWFLSPVALSAIEVQRCEAAVPWHQTKALSPAEFRNVDVREYVMKARPSEYVVENNKEFMPHSQPLKPCIILFISQTIFTPQVKSSENRDLSDTFSQPCRHCHSLTLSPRITMRRPLSRAK